MNDMGNAVYDQESQLSYLKNRLNLFLNVIDSLDPEETKLEDIDKLLGMLDFIEMKIDRYKKDHEDEE